MKRYLDKTEGKLPTNLWRYEEVGHTDEAKKELKRVFDGRVPFETPKPIRLIRRILDIASDEDSVILDFFAGSASTAEAVLQYNLEKGGRRRFIMCTNNENGICREVAYERVRRVVEGYAFNGKLRRVVFEGKMTAAHVSKPEKFAELSTAALRAQAEAKARYGKASVKVEDGFVRVVAEERCDGRTDPVPGSLKYMRVGYIPFDEGRTYEIADEVLRHVRELVELENGIDFSADLSVAIALTDDELDDVVASRPDGLRAVYLGRDVLVPASAEAMLRGLGAAIHVIPDYYYRELGD